MELDVALTRDAIGVTSPPWLEGRGRYLHGLEPYVASQYISSKTHISYIGRFARFAVVEAVSDTGCLPLAHACCLS